MRFSAIRLRCREMQYGGMRCGGAGKVSCCVVRYSVVTGSALRCHAVSYDTIRYSELMYGVMRGNAVRWTEVRCGMVTYGASGGR